MVRFIFAALVVAPLLAACEPAAVAPPADDTDTNTDDTEDTEDTDAPTDTGDTDDTGDAGDDSSEDFVCSDFGPGHGFEAHTCNEAGCEAFYGSGVYWDDELMVELYGQPGYCHMAAYGGYVACGDGIVDADTVGAYQDTSQPWLGTLTFAAPADDPTACYALVDEAVPAGWVACSEEMNQALDCTP